MVYGIILMNFEVKGMVIDMKALFKLASLVMAAAMLFVGTVGVTPVSAEDEVITQSTVIQPDTDTMEVYNIPLEITNPAVSEGFPDPELRCYEDENGNKVYWMYGTKDSNIGVLRSTDNMKTWEKPTEDGMALDKSTFPWIKMSVWAPGAIELNGKYYIVFAANNVPDSSRTGGIGIGVSDNPAGPFKAVEGSNDGLLLDPSLYGVTDEDTDEEFMAKFKDKPTLIDANLFQDSDGQVYLYYGGNKNLGVCLMNDEMNGIKAFPDGDMYKIITDGLSEYVEGPFMTKRGDTYYMYYSKGMWINGTYGGCYAMADSPLGPFYGSRQILQSSQNDYPYRGPGHNSVLYMPENNMWLICYHRYNYGSSDRKACIDRLAFNEDGTIRAVIQTDYWTTDDYFGLDESNLALNAAAIDSGYGYYGSGKLENVNDADSITYWQFNTDTVCNEETGVMTDCWVGYDFGVPTTFNKVVMEWESETMCTEDGFELQYSDDGETWTAVPNVEMEYGTTTVLTFDAITARYLRIDMTKKKAEKWSPKIFELEVYCDSVIIGDDEYLLGDVTGDGEINSTDFMRVKRYYLGLYEMTETEKLAADVNVDGKIDSTDFTRIRRHFLGLYDLYA